MSEPIESSASVADEQEKRPIVDSETATRTSFTLRKEVKGSSFHVDSLNKISKVVWHGHVDKETATTLLTLGGDSVEFEGFTRLLLDRRDLSEFDTEARVWIKDLLKTRAKKLSPKVKKLAIINAHSSLAIIFSNMMASAIGLIIPNLNLKKFDNEEEALEWLCSS